MATDSLYEIHIEPGHPTCRVIQGAARRMYFSTPHAVAMALLNTEERDEESARRDLLWTDHLASHGVAVGVRGQRVASLTVSAPHPRQVRVLNRAGAYTVVSITFPALLMSMLLTDGRFTRGNIMVIKPDTLPTLSVTSQTRCLTSFPWGNVYAGTGAICWGNVQGIRDIRSMAEFDALFFGTGFNGDLWNAGQTSLLGLSEANGGVIAAPTSAERYTLSIQTVIDQLMRG